MSGERVQVLAAEDGVELALVTGEGCARAIVWSGVGATQRALHRFSLGPRARTREQRHAGEAVYAVLAGDGEVHDLSAAATHKIVAGSMFHVEPETAYAITAGNGGLEVVGGPAPVDPALYDLAKGG